MTRRVSLVGSGAFLLLGVLAGCFSPSPVSGAPCNSNGDCPSGLVCSPQNTCERNTENKEDEDASSVSCQTISATCVDPSILRSCTAVGAAAVDTVCAWGCIDGMAARCGVLVPAGGGVEPQDLESTGLAAVELANVTIDSDGTISGLAGGFAFQVKNNISVFRFGSLTISGSVAVTGSRAIAIVSDGSIVVDGIVDVRGPCTENMPGPGGFSGGQVSSTAVGSGAGTGGTDGGDGGGGGGFGGDGGRGVGGQPGGAVHGDSAITTLVGGGGGGGGRSSKGGGGGGALQLVSNTSIAIDAMGGVNAGGCGGGAATGGLNAAGGGGGAGGTILLEAPVVTIAGALAVNGGAGGGGNVSEVGASGRLDRIPAGPLNGGGAGGAGSSFAGGNGIDEGGGGGGVGRIRVNTRGGIATVQPSATLSPAFGDPSTTATMGTARVQ